MTKIEAYCNLTEEERDIISGMDQDRIRLMRRLPEELIGVAVIKYNDLFDRILSAHNEQVKIDIDRIRLFTDFMSNLYDNNLVEYENVLHTLYLLKEFYIMDSKVLESVKKMEYSKIDEMIKKAGK